MNKISIKNPRKCRPGAWIAVLIVAWVLIFHACSGGDKKEQINPETNATADESSRRPNDQVGRDQALQDREARIGPGDYEMTDRGTPCQNHRYYIPIGGSETLSFQVQLSGKDMETITPDDLEIRDNTWDDFGIEVSVFGGQVENVAVLYPIWRVDGREYYSEKLAQGINPEYATAGFTTVEWQANGQGVITRVQGHGNAQSVGKFSEEEMQQKIGENMTLTYQDTRTGKTYTWQVIADTMEEETKIMSFDLNVTLPDQGVSLRDIGLQVWAGTHRWWIKAAYSTDRQQFIISGPALSPGCLQTTEVE